MKKIIFLINILLPQEGLQYLIKNRVFLLKNLARSAIGGKKTRFLRELCVNLGLAG